MSETANDRATEAWWTPFETGDFDRRRDLEIFYEPALRYASVKWGRGDYHAREEVSSIAGEVLVLAALDTTYSYEPNSREFWAMVKTRIDWTMGRYFESRRYMLSYDLYEEDPADAVTELRVKRRDLMLLNGLADYYASMPTVLKTAVGLHFFEQLTYASLGELADSQRRVRDWVSGVTQHLAAVARNQVYDEPRDIPTLPTFKEAAASNFMFEANIYTNRAYGLDVYTWLGWVQIALRQDVFYLATMIDHGNGRMVHFGNPVTIDYDADVDHLDTLDPPPQSRDDVMKRTGWAGSRSQAAMRAWRTRHGLGTREKLTARSAA